MKKKNNCERLFKIIGDFWTLSIINSLKEKELRFCELQRAVNNLNPVTLTNRLKRLEKAGFITRKKESLDKLSVAYSLNKKGLALIPIINDIHVFANKFED